MKIKDIFEKSIDRRIEEVIKVTQIEESVVYDEISEYVVWFRKVEFCKDTGVYPRGAKYFKRRRS